MGLTQNLREKGARFKPHNPPQRSRVYKYGQDVFLQFLEFLWCSNLPVCGISIKQRCINSKYMSPRWRNIFRFDIRGLWSDNFYSSYLSTASQVSSMWRWSQDVLTTLTKRPFTELPLQCLELVSKLRPPCQFHQLQLYRCWAGPSTSSIPFHWTSGRFNTGRKRC